MVSNRIRTLLSDRKMSAKKLSDELTDCNAAILSYIINGRALPTAASLKEMCELLGCAPTDLYDSKDVDLLSVFEKWRTDVACLDSEVGKWFDPEESAALRKALAALGYSCVGEWIREMWRSTLLKYLESFGGPAINLSEVILAESQGE